MVHDRYSSELRVVQANMYALDQAKDPEQKVDLILSAMAQLEDMLRILTEQERKAA